MKLQTRVALIKLKSTANECIECGIDLFPTFLSNQRKAEINQTKLIIKNQVTA